MQHHRTVSADVVVGFSEGIERVAPVRYAETSMRNGFGLRYLHKFLNVPFLQLQRESLQQQLLTNERETQLTLQELDLYQETNADNSYDKYVFDNIKNNACIKLGPIKISTGLVIT
jgi:hypothetical protein